MLKQAGFGFVVGFAALHALASCAGASQAVECQVSAILLLPPDEDRITLGDLRDTVGRLKACRGDAGP